MLYALTSKGNRKLEKLICVTISLNVTIFRKDFGGQVSAVNSRVLHTGNPEAKNYPNL